jgi:hypothetical protein
MNRFFFKYKEVIVDTFILICLILISIDFDRDFFLGAASGAILIKLGESVGNVRRQKNHDLQQKEIIQ